MYWSDISNSFFFFGVSNIFGFGDIRKGNVSLMKIVRSKYVYLVWWWYIYIVGIVWK